MYDSCLAKHSLTEAPFPSNGPPPSNFTNSVARQIIRAHAGPGRITRSKTRSALLSSGRKAQEGSGSGSSDVEDSTSEVEMDAPAPKKWRHGLRATRLKILSLGRSTLSLSNLLSRQVTNMGSIHLQSKNVKTLTSKLPLVNSTPRLHRNEENQWFVKAVWTSSRRWTTRVRLPGKLLLLFLDQNPESL